MWSFLDNVRGAHLLSSLHIPGQPLVLTNVWDPPTTTLALANKKTRAIATATFAIAGVEGVEDDDLTLEQNLAGVARISARIRTEGREKDVPLTVDLQSGYGDRLGEAVKKVVDLGAVGINLGDSGVAGGLRDVDEQVERIKKTIEMAANAGVEGFVVNARTDAILLGGTVDEAIRRGKKYLEAGATTVFVWGGPGRGLKEDEVVRVTKELNGRVNVFGLGIDNALTVKELGTIGVGRKDQCVAWIVLGSGQGCGGKNGRIWDQTVA